MSVGCMILIAFDALVFVPRGYCFKWIAVACAWSDVGVRECWLHDSYYLWYLGIHSTRILFMNCGSVYMLELLFNTTFLFKSSHHNHNSMIYFVTIILSQIEQNWNLLTFTACCYGTKLWPRLLIPTVGVVKSHKMAIATVSLSMNPQICYHHQLGHIWSLVVHMHRWLLTLWEVLAIEKGEGHIWLEMFNLSLIYLYINFIGARNVSLMPLHQLCQCTWMDTFITHAHTKHTDIMHLSMYTPTIPLPDCPR